MTPKAQKTEAVREMMLELHLQAVRALIPINYESHVKPQLRRQQH